MRTGRELRLWLALPLVIGCWLVADGVRSTPARAEPVARTSLIARIDSLIAASRTDSAQKVIDECLPPARADADPSLLLGLLSRRGQIFASFDRAKEAEPILVEAVALAEALGDSAALILSLRWLGVSVDRLGRRAEARQINLRLQDLAIVRGDRGSEGWALYGLGWQADQDGSISEAARLYRLALDLFLETGDARGEIWAWNGLGSVTQRRGGFREATECYEKAMQRAIETGHTTGQLRALNNLGTVEFSVGDPTKALDAFQRAYELQMREGNLREALTPGLNVALCQTVLGRYREAEEGLEKSLALCVTEGWQDLEGKLRNQLAHVKYAQGMFSEAVRVYRECLALKEALALQTRIQAGLGLSNALAEMDSSAAALRELDAAAQAAGGRLVGEGRVNFMGLRAARLLALDRPAEALRTVREVNAEMVRLGQSSSLAGSLALTARAFRALGMRDSCLVYLERAREVWEATRRVSTNPDWRERRGLVGRRIYTDLAAELIDRPPATPGRTAVAEAFDRLQVFKARTLLERMRGPEMEPPPDTQAAAGERNAGDETIGSAELQAILQPGEVFLDCYVGDERSFIFAVTREQVRCAPMPIDRLLSEQARLYLAILTDVVGAEPSNGSRIVAQTAAHIDSILFGGVHAILEGKERIFISPDVPLHSIPYGLAGSLGLRSGQSTPAHWIKVPSATVLWRIRSARSSNRSPERILALSGGSRPGRPTLSGARSEVGRLARLYRHVEADLPLTGTAAEPDWLALQGYGLLHFAAHARVLDQAPWQSEIELGADQESSLQARQIAALALHASLVVLSSCESAHGGIMSGEGVTGLTSAFLAAGVPAVVATLWPVDDRVTARLMEHFYEALAEGHSVGSALARAQAIIRDDPRTSAPFYWAGFVLIGDDQTMVTLEKRSGLGMRLVAGAVPLGLVGLAVCVWARPRTRKGTSR